ncbi:hypothetical protein TWF225_009465 [Orbilia oligospora]|nr:hypothetical protein TWF225_009465 [Orbilia oligospora]KAF3259448.1 hypothetical protein TWF217_005146 [Orbilia oligospora]KAF3263930.1 hypothetical protein TWF128_001566 [Orbilia oligospora]KAF3287753.1 hypothetical protein TWF132_008275 [Orbilia oligospora]
MFSPFGNSPAANPPQSPSEPPGAPSSGPVDRSRTASPTKPGQGTLLTIQGKKMAAARSRAQTPTLEASSADTSLNINSAEAGNGNVITASSQNPVLAYPTSKQNDDNGYHSSSHSDRGPQGDYHPSSHSEPDDEEEDEGSEFESNKPQFIPIRTTITTAPSPQKPNQAGTPRMMIKRVSMTNVTTSPISGSKYVNVPGVLIGSRTFRDRSNIRKPISFETMPVAVSKRRGLSKREQIRRSRQEERNERFAVAPKRQSLSRNAKNTTQGRFKEELSDYDDLFSSDEGSGAMSGVGSDEDERPKRRTTSSRAAPKRSIFEEPENEDMTRAQIRAALTAETARRRSNFLITHKDTFQPLVGDSNYLKKLEEEYGSTVESPIPFELLESQPKEIQATMKPYQVEGLSWLLWLNKNGLSGILGDEMGLGKTLQTLSLFSFISSQAASEIDKSHPHRPFLVVCPLSVLTSWVNEAKKFVPHLRAMRLHGPIKERMRLKRLAEKGLESGKDGSENPVHPENPKRGWDIIVTSYDTFVAEKVWFKRAFIWRYVALDEGHQIKNSETLSSQSLQSINAEYRLILTGTPIQNNLFELWSLVHWLYPEVFTNRTCDEWRQAFDLTRGKVDTSFVDCSRNLLELIMKRRTKQSPGISLGIPDKEEVVLYVPLSPMQRMWYTMILTKLDNPMLERLFKNSKDKESVDKTAAKEEARRLDNVEIRVDNDGEEVTIKADNEEWNEVQEAVKKSIEQVKSDPSWRKLMNILIQLRKICNHPYLIPAAEPEPYQLGQHIITASGKFMVLEKLIRQLVILQGRKVLIFSNFTKTLDICEEFLQIIGGDGSQFEYLRLDGSTGRARRNLSIRLFNQAGSPYKVFLISTKAGGLGINLTSATEVVMIDANWNPQADLQAMARSHRIGQTKKVTVYKLVTQGTVEEQMIGRIQKKLYLSAKVTESMRDIHGSKKPAVGPSSLADEEDDAPKFTMNQLMTLVRRGAQAIARPEIDPKEMMAWDWETMLEKCKNYTVVDHDGDDQDEDETTKKEREEEWLNSAEKVETRLFEGKKMGKEEMEKQVKAATEAELDRSDRRAGKNRTVMVDGYEVLKETVGNDQWEAVATMAGKDPRLKDPPKRKKAKITNQDYCQVCTDGGDIVCCSSCPRSYHYDCLDEEHKYKSNGKMQYHCSQHECHDCEQKTSDAGNMLYRCRFCERAYCEDCLDFDNAKLIGDEILEYQLLDYYAIPQAFYVECHNCVESRKDPEYNATCLNIIREAEEERDRRQKVKEEEIAEAKKKAEKMEVESMTDGTTIAGGSSGIITPAGEVDGDNNVIIVDADDVDSTETTGGKKRKTRGKAAVKKENVKVGRGKGTRKGKKANVDAEGEEGEEDGGVKDEGEETATSTISAKKGRGKGKKQENGVKTPRAPMPKISVPKKGGEINGSGQKVKQTGLDAFFSKKPAIATAGVRSSPRKRKDVNQNLGGDEISGTATPVNGANGGGSVSGRSTPSRGAKRINEGEEEVKGRKKVKV